jgi:hypothetical protein
MTVVPNPDTTQVRDLNRILDWLDGAEEHLIKDYPKFFEGCKDRDIKARIYGLIFFSCIRAMNRVANNEKNEEESLDEYYSRLPLIEYILTASIYCEMAFQDIRDQAGLENSFLVFDVNDYLPSLIRDLLRISGDVDTDKLSEALYVPASTFIIPPLQ